ncbi:MULTISPECIES: RidA family protein [Halorubrum]|uniref:2-iminobutanoate/2-iminopropanoate deaminase n=2 Tax=Halorubrum TaxID=56688 RepID=A0A8T4GHQ4_9EURY|nr:RidA family protein [Halorubrum alkaliphilum]MBP1923776.1 2-iminobutanoate/2-iminopropanoate deaminase [Halorubrum alkaliphilum]
MSQQTTGSEPDQHRTDEMSYEASLSTESKRQRDGTGNIGAFGKRTGSSDLRFFEGILPEVEGELLSGHSIEEQFTTALDRLESALADNRNLTLNDVMKLEIQLTDPSAAEAVDHVYESRFDDVELPPRTVVGVCSLPGGADVQLDVIAAEE